MTLWGRGNESVGTVLFDSPKVSQKEPSPLTHYPVPKDSKKMLDNLLKNDIIMISKEIVLVLL